MDAWLVIVAIIVATLTLALVFYLVVLFSSEDDENQAWLPKVIVVLGLSLACFNVLLLPYDVANKQHPEVANSTGGGVDTVLVWQMVMISVALFCFLIVPFSIFYYEAYDPEQSSIFDQIRPAFCFTTISFMVFTILLFVLWLTLGEAAIPFQAYTTNAQRIDVHNYADATCGQMSFQIESSDDTLNIKVSWFVYLVGLMSAAGWVLFFVFGGVGIVAMPLDFIDAYRDRPKPITAADYAKMREEIGKESARLVPIGKQLDEQGRQNDWGKKYKKKAARFKHQVEELETAYTKLEISYREQGGSVLKAWLGLFVGLLSILLSTGWVLHIILCNLFKLTPFLNSFFIALDDSFSLLGILAYGVFAFFLLWCVVKGCTKIGCNLLLITLYPMKINGTMMNAFLFNTLLIMIASVSVVQFCSISFREYAVNTSADSLFSNYIERLKGLNYIVMYLQYPMLAIIGLTMLWLFICPKRKPKEDDDE